MRSRTVGPASRVARSASAGLLLALLAAPGPSRSQELEPRTYAPAPIGANIALVAYSYQEGDVLFDPAVPLTDVRAFINAAIPGFARSFNLAGRYASVALGVPYVWASVRGNVGEDYREITRSGLGDARFRFVVNLLNAPALSPREWVARKPKPTLGFSLTVQAPTGQYSPAKLINIGSNRWAVKPELGLSFPTGKWTLEASAGAWLFTHNTSAFPGNVVRSQDPLFSFQGHVGYTVRPGLWVAANATYYAGGKTYADDVPSDTRQSNTRAGLTVSVPVARGHTVKLSVSSGVSVRVGSKFDSYGLAYQYVWFDPKPAPPAAPAKP